VKNIEKNKQVLLMGEIYQKAKNTVVWLGEEDKDNKVLLEMVKLFAGKSSNTLENDINLIRPQLDLPSKQQMNRTLIDRGRWRHQALVRLLNRQWFTRVLGCSFCLYSFYCVLQIIKSSKNVLYPDLVAIAGLTIPTRAE
jgi:hypothetical protein